MKYLNRFLNWFINRYLIAGIMLVSILCGLSVLMLLLYILFNLNPYYEFKSKDNSLLTIGSNLRAGVDVVINPCTTLHDTSIYYKTKKGSSGNLDFTGTKNLKIREGDSIINSDTIFSKSKLTYWNDSLDDRTVAVSAIKIPTVYVKIKAKNFNQRLQYTLPSLLLLTMLTYCLWQLAKFLHTIQLNEPFYDANYKRLQNIGSALLAFQLVMFVFHTFFQKFNIHVDFGSSIPNWRSPINFSSSPSSGFDLTYFTFGCVFIILAKAFKKGTQIKEEQDLTV